MNNLLATTGERRTGRANPFASADRREGADRGPFGAAPSGGGFAAASTVLSRGGTAPSSTTQTPTGASMLTPNRGPTSLSRRATFDDDGMTLRPPPPGKGPGGQGGIRAIVDWNMVERELERVQETYKNPSFTSLPQVVEILGSSDPDRALQGARDQQRRIETLIEQIVRAYHQGFNRALHNYSEVLRLFTATQNDIGALRQCLSDARNRLGARAEDLSAHWQKSLALKDVVRILDDVELLLKAPAQCKEAIRNRDFVRAARILSDAAISMSHREIGDVRSLRDLRQELSVLRQELEDSLNLELGAWLYRGKEPAEGSATVVAAAAVAASGGAATSANRPRGYQTDGNAAAHGLMGSIAPTVQMIMDIGGMETSLERLKINLPLEFRGVIQEAIVQYIRADPMPTSATDDGDGFKTSTAKAAAASIGAKLELSSRYQAPGHTPQGLTIRIHRLLDAVFTACVKSLDRFIKLSEGLCTMTRGTNTAHIDVQFRKTPGKPFVYSKETALADIKYVWQQLQEECKVLLADVLGAPLNLAALVAQTKQTIQAAQSKGAGAQVQREAALHFTLLQDDEHSSEDTVTGVSSVAVSTAGTGLTSSSGGKKGANAGEKRAVDSFDLKTLLKQALLGEKGLAGQPTSLNSNIRGGTAAPMAASSSSSAGPLPFTIYIAPVVHRPSMQFTDQGFSKIENLGRRLGLPVTLWAIPEDGGPLRYYLDSLVEKIFLPKAKADFAALAERVVADPEYFRPRLSGPLDGQPDATPSSHAQKAAGAGVAKNKQLNRTSLRADLASTIARRTSTHSALSPAGSINHRGASMLSSDGRGASVVAGPAGVGPTGSSSLSAQEPSMSFEILVEEVTRSALSFAVALPRYSSEMSDVLEDFLTKIMKHCEREYTRCVGESTAAILVRVPEVAQILATEPCAALLMALQQRRPANARGGGGGGTALSIMNRELLGVINIGPKLRDPPKNVLVNPHLSKELTELPRREFPASWNPDGMDENNLRINSNQDFTAIPNVPRLAIDIGWTAHCTGTVYLPPVRAPPSEHHDRMPLAAGGEEDFRSLVHFLWAERPIQATNLIASAAQRIFLCALSSSMMRLAQLLHMLNPKGGKGALGMGTGAAGTAQQEAAIKAAIDKAGKEVTSTLEELRKQQGGGIFNWSKKPDLSQGIGGGTLPSFLTPEMLAGDGPDDPTGLGSRVRSQGAASIANVQSAKQFVWTSKLQDLQLKFAALAGQTLRVLRLDLALASLREMTASLELPWSRERFGVTGTDSQVDSQSPLHAACNVVTSLHPSIRNYLQPQHASYVFGLAGGCLVLFYQQALKDAREVSRGALAQIHKSMEHAEEVFNPLMPNALDLRAGRGVAAIVVRNPNVAGADVAVSALSAATNARPAPGAILPSASSMHQFPAVDDLFPVMRVWTPLSEYAHTSRYLALLELPIELLLERAKGPEQALFTRDEWMSLLLVAMEGRGCREPHGARMALARILGDGYYLAYGELAHGLQMVNLRPTITAAEDGVV